MRQEQGVVGREKGGRRLTNPVFKMADELMANSAEILNRSQVTLPSCALSSGAW